jgi:hypothetical protein
MTIIQKLLSSRPRFIPGLMLHERCVVSDTRGRLWQIDPNTRQVVRVTAEEKSAPAQA